MNRAAKGRRNEHRSRAILEAMGYEVVRAGASKGVFDLWAIRATDMLLVQCKSRDWPSSVETEAIRSFRCPANCRKLIHRYRDRERMPDVRELQ
jgi:Holliday junction resolvase